MLSDSVGGSPGEGVVTDTLATLVCSANDLPMWNGAAWVCAATGSIDTKLTEGEVDAMVANNNFSTGTHTIDTKLNEAEVDAMVANNNFSTGAHTVDTKLTEAEVDSMVSNNGYLTSSSPGNSNIRAGRVQVSGSNESTLNITLSYGSTFSSAPYLVATPSLNGTNGGEIPSTQIVSIGTESAHVRLYRSNGTFHPSTTFSVDWIAVGAP